jgi:hypothetical protein
MTKGGLRKGLYGAFRNRALMYHEIYKELKKKVGEKKAADIMGRGIYNRGLKIGSTAAKYGPDNMEGLKKWFLGLDPDEGKMFKAEILRCDAEGLDIKFHGCPLRDAWQEAGLSDREVMKICRIAARVDNGTFEGAGFEFFAENWEPKFGECCYLHIRPGKKGKAKAGKGPKGKRLEVKKKKR